MHRKVGKDKRHLSMQGFTGLEDRHRSTCVYLVGADGVQELILGAPAAQIGAMAILRLRPGRERDNYAPQLFPSNQAAGYCPYACIIPPSSRSPPRLYQHQQHTATYPCTGSHHQSRRRLERYMAAPPMRKRQFGISMDRSLPKYQFWVMFSVERTTHRERG